MEPEENKNDCKVSDRHPYCNTSIQGAKSGLTRRVELHLIVILKDPLAKLWSRLGKSFDFRAGNIGVVLEFLAKVLAVVLQVFLDVFLAHRDFVKIEPNRLINDIVDSLNIVVDISIAASEFVAATNVDRSARIL